MTLHDGPTRVGHCRIDNVDVYVGRHGHEGAKTLLSWAQGDLDAGEPGWLGNPYRASEYGVVPSVRAFMQALLALCDDSPAARRELVERCRGQTLGCWCRTLDEEIADDGANFCHADAIAKVVDDVIVRRRTPGEVVYQGEVPADG